MNQKHHDALNFFSTRRSVPPALLKEPAPSGDELKRLLTLAARVPDHGKLEPWRFVVLRGEALSRLAPLVEAGSVAMGNPPEKAAKHGNAFRVPLVVAVVSSPVHSEKVPEWEQFLSAGAVCLGLLNACLTSGYGASWLTGIASRPEFARAHLGLTGDERIAGLIHIGSRGDSAPPERPRPDIDALTTILE
ncbi:nitroreductase family protein [Paracoccus aerodenitrificans]|uniref:nitroreductase family protein n=1 Tax=Paracoccus aerodenitrificans TaxID=3017781 RepID=UPI0022F10F65|nr:nitroreductase [Paracoccus aerodenitrificans]WBU64413.1 nitroreductase [Paracoccus aerodenitrificans]